MRLLDVGTGLGVNLAAAWSAVAAAGAALAVDALELSADVIARGIALARDPRGERAPGAEARRAVAAVLERALARPGAEVPLEGSGRVRLLLGDARAAAPALPSSAYAAVFLDPFSPRVEPELWSPELCAHLARALAPGGRLSTYSAATRVRAALRAAGLAVGPGPRVGAKAEGTVAARGGPVPPFAERVERRVARAALALRPGG